MLVTGLISRRGAQFDLANRRIEEAGARWAEGRGLSSSFQKLDPQELAEDSAEGQAMPCHLTPLGQWPLVSSFHETDLVPSPP